MDYNDLKQGIEQAPATSKHALDLLFMYVTAGDGVVPEWAPYLEDATTYKEFFDAIYNDEAKKDTNVWGEWAKLTRKTWIPRFDAALTINSIRIKTDGLPVGFESGVMLAPTGSRDNVVNLYVFDQGAFNTSAADFVTSIGGTFTCAGYDFVGVYGVYSYRGSVILETWTEEKPPVPSNKQ